MHITEILEKLGFNEADHLLKNNEVDLDRVAISIYTLINYFNLNNKLNLQILNILNILNIEIENIYFSIKYVKHKLVQFELEERE